MRKKWKGWVKILLILFLITDLFGNMGYFAKERTKDFFKKSKSLEIISLDEGDFRAFFNSKNYLYGYYHLMSLISLKREIFLP